MSAVLEAGADEREHLVAPRFRVDGPLARFEGFEQVVLITGETEEIVLLAYAFGLGQMLRATAVDQLDGS